MVLTIKSPDSSSSILPLRVRTPCPSSDSTIDASKGVGVAPSPYIIEPFTMKCRSPISFPSLFNSGFLLFIVRQQSEFLHDGEWIPITLRLFRRLTDTSEIALNLLRCPSLKMITTERQWEISLGRFTLFSHRATSSQLKGVPTASTGNRNDEEFLYGYGSASSRTP